MEVRLLEGRRKISKSKEEKFTLSRWRCAVAAMSEGTLGLMWSYVYLFWQSEDSIFETTLKSHRGLSSNTQQKKKKIAALQPCKHSDPLSIFNFSFDLLGLKIMREIMSVSRTSALCGDEACQDFLTEATHAVFNYSIWRLLIEGQCEESKDNYGRWF